MAGNELDRDSASDIDMLNTENIKNTNSRVGVLLVTATEKSTQYLSCSMNKLKCVIDCEMLSKFEKRKMVVSITFIDRHTLHKEEKLSGNNTTFVKNCISDISKMKTKGNEQIYISHFSKEFHDLDTPMALTDFNPTLRYSKNSIYLPNNALCQALKDKQIQVHLVCNQAFDISKIKKWTYVALDPIQICALKQGVISVHVSKKNSMFDPNKPNNLNPVWFAQYVAQKTLDIKQCAAEIYRFHLAYAHKQAFPILCRYGRRRFQSQKSFPLPILQRYGVNPQILEKQINKNTFKLADTELYSRQYCGFGEDFVDELTGAMQEDDNKNRHSANNAMPIMNEMPIDEMLFSSNDNSIQKTHSNLSTKPIKFFHESSNESDSSSSLFAPKTDTATTKRYRGVKVQSLKKDSKSKPKSKKRLKNTAESDYEPETNTNSSNSKRNKKHSKRNKRKTRADTTAELDNIKSVNTHKKTSRKKKHKHKHKKQKHKKHKKKKGTSSDDSSEAEEKQSKRGRKRKRAPKLKNGEKECKIGQIYEVHCDPAGQGWKLRLKRLSDNSILTLGSDCPLYKHLCVWECDVCQCELVYLSFAKHKWPESFKYNDRTELGKRQIVKSVGVACGNPVCRAAARAQPGLRMSEGAWINPAKAQKHQKTCGYKMIILKGQPDFPTWWKKHMSAVPQDGMTTAVQSDDTTMDEVADKLLKDQRKKKHKVEKSD